MKLKQLASKLSISGLLFFLNCRSNTVVPANIEFRFKKNVKIGNHLKTYKLVFPKNYYLDNKLFPLMNAMHGGGRSTKQMETIYGLPEISDKIFV